MRLRHDPWNSGARHDAIETPDGLLDVVEWKIVAIATPVGIIEVEKVWFTLEMSIRRGV
jgi:hypothetical protein